MVASIVESKLIVSVLARRDVGYVMSKECGGANAGS